MASSVSMLVAASTFGFLAHDAIALTHAQTNMAESLETLEGAGHHPTFAMWHKLAHAKGACMRTISPKNQSVLFGAHHKTGTVMMEQVKTCLGKTHPELTVMVDEHIQGKHAIRNFTKVVHWVRNPFSVIVSSYLYHRDVGEEWGKEPGSAKTILKHLNLVEGEVDAKPKESYKDLLLRIPEEVGLHTEMRRFLKPLKEGVGTLTGREALEISSAHVRCTGHYSKCMEVCLEPFVDGTMAYMSSWKTVMDFIGVCLDDEEEWPLRLCLEKADINSPQFDGYFRHITRHSVTKQANDRLMQIVQNLDLSLHNGATKLLEQSLGCF